MPNIFVLFSLLSLKYRILFLAYMVGCFHPIACDSSNAVISHRALVKFSAGSVCLWPLIA